MLTNELFIEMSFDEWLEKYKPITNHIDPNASFQNESGSGIMFETYGDEVEFVKAQDENRIWTYGDGDDGGGYVWNGWHYINRLGYFITEVDESPIECDTCGVYIYDPEEDDHECEED